MLASKVVAPSHWNLFELEMALMPCPWRVSVDGAVGGCHVDGYCYGGMREATQIHNVACQGRKALSGLEHHRMN